MEKLKYALHVTNNYGNCRLNLETLIDFANVARREIAEFKVPFVLSPGKLMAGGHTIPSLTWESVSYGDEDLEKVPDDRRGVYAFAVCHNDGILPPHGYILYIGIAGKDSYRPLRERYKDYLNFKKVAKRDQIAFMIGTWHQVLRFFFAPVEDDVSSEELKTIEEQLNTALMPPFSNRDLEANTRRMRRAFRT